VTTGKVQMTSTFIVLLLRFGLVGIPSRQIVHAHAPGAVAPNRG
jgi:hypothetical protein